MEKLASNPVTSVVVIVFSAPTIAFVGIPFAPFQNLCMPWAAFEEPRSRAVVELALFPCLCLPRLLSKKNSSGTTTGQLQMLAALLFRHLQDVSEFLPLSPRPLKIKALEHRQDERENKRDIYICIYVYMYICIYIERDREEYTRYVKTTKTNNDKRENRMGEDQSYTSVVACCCFLLTTASP